MHTHPQFETWPDLWVRSQSLIAGLRRHGLKLGSAESCTGGLFGSLISEHAGVSDVYLGGIIAYDNSIKEKCLSVSSDDLSAFGAVSPEVALSMAQGARDRLQVDIALSVSGIAGPGGGSVQKPIGMVCFGLSACCKGLVFERHITHYFDNIGRQPIRLKSVDVMITLANDYIDILD